MTQQQFDQLIHDVCGVEVSDSQRPLVDLGIDSLGYLSLVMAVEEHYGVEIDPEALTDPELSTPAGLRGYVESLAVAA
jgi:acyl carrier protein